MNRQTTTLFACLFLIFIVGNTAIAQDYLASAERPVKKETALTAVRFQKKMPAGYDGYVVQIAASEYPMQRDEPVFRQFGNVYYDKLREGGFSYVIMTHFSDLKSALDFCENVVRGKVADAKVIEYDNGVRTIKK